ncbi:MAG: hypothetical protein HYZ50_15230 [Deltaproteobacteria bacterium]|nr:hypothetical protein [Deltaproteobacteria bacterium]
MIEDRKAIPTVIPASVHVSVQKLIRQIDQASLDGARNRAFEELRLLPLPREIVDRVLRQISEQKSKEGIRACLASFAQTLRSIPHPDVNAG